LIRPGTPITVSSAFFRLSYWKKPISESLTAFKFKKVLTKSIISSIRLRRSCFDTSRWIRNIA
jgi:hypothetical protein